MLDSENEIVTYLKSISRKNKTRSSYIANSNLGVETSDSWKKLKNIALNHVKKKVIPEML